MVPQGVKFLVIISLSLMIPKTFADFYLNLENVNTEKSSQFGATIEVNKISVVRSVCVRFLVTQTEKAQTILYTPDKDDLVLQFSFKSKYGFLRINRKWIIFRIPVPTIPYVYKHLCISHNETNYSVVSDGILWYSFQLLPSNIPTVVKPVNITQIIFGPAGYSLINGGYFLGRLSELYIFSNSFTDDELISITKSCKRIGKGSKVFDWSKLLPSEDIIIPKDDADIRIVKRSVEDICATVKNKQIDLLPFKMNTQTATGACKSLGGTMFYPTIEDTESVRKDFNRNNSVLQKLVKKSCGGAGKIVWLPVYKIGLSHWVDFDNHSRDIGPNGKQIVVNGNDLQNCAYLKTSTYYYGDIPCSSKYCTFCKWDQKKQFTLRGLCEIDSLEDHYLLTNYLFFNGILGKNKNIQSVGDNAKVNFSAFYGYSKHSLVFEEEYNTWAIINITADEVTFTLDHDNYKVLAVLSPEGSKSQLPTGLNKWKIFDSECEEEADLKFTVVNILHTFLQIFLMLNNCILQCTSTEFTCNNGVCIHMDYRCDGVYDCTDESDESDCDIVKIEEGKYKKAMAPERNGKEAEVNVSIFIQNVEKIELPSTFHAKIELSLTWTDYRLEYLNLHENNIIDSTTKQKIWIPRLLFSNSNDNRYTDDDEKTTISIIKSGSPQTVGLNMLHETYIFKGSENYLNYYRKYYMVFKCAYDLHDYPFDTQVCTIDLQLSKFDNDSVNLIPDLTENKGPDKLDQFAITHVWLVANSDKSLVQCKIRLKRKPMYFIATTFMPTICILFMALVTLFIDQSHFEAIIMVALTAMLVMYTLFQSVAISLPTTAYLKLLDYWLIFGLIMPFFVFSAEVINELIMERSTRVQVKSANKMYGEVDTKFIIYARYVLCGITVAFTFIYMIIALIIYLSS